MKVSIACIAYENGKVLIAHRNNTGDMGGRWEFPGGKVDGGESDQESIVREMQEEFGMKVQVLDFITETSFYHRDKESLLHAYLIKVPHCGIENPYVLTEHSEYKWTGIDEIPVDNFVDSDLKIYPAVKEFIKRRFS